MLCRRLPVWGDAHSLAPPHCPGLSSGLGFRRPASPGINHGLDRVRFPAPVPVGSKIRAAATLTDVNQTHLGSLAHIRMRVEIEGQSKAACVASTRLLFIR